ncbi:hypothetical protein B0H16DRAFT_91208 [Mycena metata]|uniref:Uncharacterized protein n=1 Tax=Mycena metata TaxID=1033252 RepID=A0AAD7IAA6_9AGAR|nr:hypothetical protein B0H16DRAFT_91208 [Mycena metata]
MHRPCSPGSQETFRPTIHQSDLGGGFYQPLIYESVNLRTYGDAKCLFLHTLPGNKFLLAKITYLSFAFVIPVADTPESPLWVAVRASLPEMSSLDMLITSFTHADPDPLGRVLSHLLHAVALPSRLRTLHLRSAASTSRGRRYCLSNHGRRTYGPYTSPSSRPPFWSSFSPRPTISFRRLPSPNSRSWGARGQLNFGLAAL